ATGTPTCCATSGPGSSWWASARTRSRRCSSTTPPASSRWRNDRIDGDGIVTTEAAVQALLRVLELLDAEDWEGLVGQLSEDVELADELTSTWLRGRERVAAYLRASEGIVTEIRSVPSSIHSRALSGDEAIVTFDLRQRYRFDDVEHKRDLTGCAAFR